MQTLLLELFDDISLVSWRRSLYALTELASRRLVDSLIFFLIMSTSHHIFTLHVIHMTFLWWYSFLALFPPSLSFPEFNRWTPFDADLVSFSSWKGRWKGRSLYCYIKMILTLSGLSLATKPWRSSLFLSCDAMLRPHTRLPDQRCEKAGQVGIDTWYQSTCAIFEVVSRSLTSMRS